MAALANALSVSGKSLWKLWRAPLLWFAVAGLAACTPHVHPAVDTLDAGDEPDTALPPCQQTGVVYGVGVDHQPIDLPPDGTLPVTQGFQGFLFVRVGLRSLQPLPGVLKAKVHVVLDNGIDIWVPYRTVKSTAWNTGAQTTNVPVYFNDSPLPELLSRKAAIDVVVSTSTCTMTAHSDAVLTVGGFMAADSGFWADAEDQLETK